MTHLGPKNLQTRTGSLQKRKVSVPVLPAINKNRFFKPVEHNHHKNIYNKFLKDV